MFEAPSPIIEHYKDINGLKYKLIAIVNSSNQLYEFHHDKWFHNGIELIHEYLKIFDNKNLYFYSKINVNFLNFSLKFMIHLIFI